MVGAVPVGLYATGGAHRPVLFSLSLSPFSFPLDVLLRVMVWPQQIKWPQMILDVSIQ